MVGIHRAPVIGVQKIAGIDLEREHRPQEPRGIDPGIVIRRQVDGIAHRIQVLAFGGMAQTMALRLDVVGFRPHDAGGEGLVVQRAVIAF